MLSRVCQATSVLVFGQFAVAPAIVAQRPVSRGGSTYADSCLPVSEFQIGGVALGADVRPLIILGRARTRSPIWPPPFSGPWVTQQQPWQPSGACSGHPDSPNTTGGIEGNFKEVFEHKALGGGGLARRDFECVPALLEGHTFRRKETTYRPAAEPRSQSRRSDRAR